MPTCTVRKRMPSGASRVRSSFSIVCLDLDALGREDLAHGVARERLVDDAVHGGLDDLGADVVRQLPGDCRQPCGIERVADRQVDAERKALDRLQRRRSAGRFDRVRLVRPVAQRMHAHLVDAGESEHAAVAPLRDVAGQPVHAHTQFTGSDASSGAGSDTARRPRSRRATTMTRLAFVRGLARDTGGGGASSSIGTGLAKRARSDRTNSLNHCSMMGPLARIVGRMSTMAFKQRIRAAGGTVAGKTAINCGKAMAARVKVSAGGNAR